MKEDLFGDLQEWDRVLSQLEELQRQQVLDEHQSGLARILRYRRNWRLEKRVLELAVEIRQSNDIFIAEVLNIVVDPEMELENRVLAARALGVLLPRRPKQGGALNLDMQRVSETLAAFATRPGPPVVIEAVQSVLESLKDK